MKHFLKTNWYKLMIGSSMFIFSIGFFINSISSVYAGKTDSTSEKSDKKGRSGTPIREYKLIGCGSGIYSVSYDDFWPAPSNWHIERIGPNN